jgi:23S rRNA (pseudouridine1915-N3)-methyltransferase
LQHDGHFRVNGQKNYLASNQRIDMKIAIWTLGKGHEANFKAAIEDFTKRINRYYPCEWKIIAPPKNAASMGEQQLKIEEGKTIVAQLGNDDYLLLLDEKGKMLDNMQFANHINNLLVRGVRQLVVLIGGAFGVDESVKKRANFTLSLSALVFPHQLVRLMIAEQLYRSCTILKNEKYHHV